MQIAQLLKPEPDLASRAVIAAEDRGVGSVNFAALLVEVGGELTVNPVAEADQPLDDTTDLTPEEDAPSKPSSEPAEAKGDDMQGTDPEGSLADERMEAGSPDLDALPLIHGDGHTPDTGLRVFASEAGGQTNTSQIPQSVEPHADKGQSSVILVPSAVSPQDVAQALPEGVSLPSSSPSKAMPVEQSRMRSMVGNVPVTETQQELSDNSGNTDGQTQMRQGIDGDNQVHLRQPLRPAHPLHSVEQVAPLGWPPQQMRSERGRGDDAAPSDAVTLGPVDRTANLLQLTPTTALPHRGVSSSTPPVVVQVSQALTTSGEGTVEIALSPAELGRVRLSLSFNGTEAQILIAAERPETLELLRRQADQLSQQFSELGYEAVSLSFSSQQSDTPSQDKAAVWAAPVSDVEEPPAIESEVMQNTSGLDLRI